MLVGDSPDTPARTSHDSSLPKDVQVSTGLALQLSS